MAKAPRGQASIGFELEHGEDFIKSLGQFVLDVQNKVVKEAIEAGTQPILSVMVANTPESDGRKGQSKSTRQKWVNSKKLKTTIKAVVRTRIKFGVVGGAIGLVGPSYSHGGGHGNLFSKNHKRKVLWGRDSGSIRVVNQFVKKTADQTRSAAQAAVTSSLASGIDREARRNFK